MDVGFPLLTLDLDLGSPGRKVLVTDGPLGPAEELGGQDEAAFRGAQNRFPATVAW